MNLFLFRYWATDSSSFFSSCTCMVSTNVEVDRLPSCYYFIVLIEREDEQILFHLLIDDNDEKVAGSNHLRAYCTFFLFECGLSSAYNH